MSLFSDLYYQGLSANERNIKFWEDYINNLKSLDFSLYCDKLKVPVLVPVGSRLCFRGEIKHTNEITVALGADYFAKCSLQQAEVLRQHRIKGAQSKLESFLKEKVFLENHLSFTKQNVYEDVGQDIIEVCSEQEDREWRVQHRENMRKYKQGQSKEKSKNEGITDEELMMRLEELELQEELEEELLAMKGDEERISNNFDNDKITKHELSMRKEILSYIIPKEEESVTIGNKEVQEKTKMDLLQQVIDKQNELDQKLSDIKNKERGVSRTEQDLISRLEEMEELDELEDEMDRLDDILDSEEVEESQPKSTKLKRSVSFVDDDESDTLELTFSHSGVEPFKEPYNPDKGISRPDHIYEAFPKLFNSETISILKKSKYVDKNTPNEKGSSVNKMRDSNLYDSEVQSNRTIVVSDIIEKETSQDTKMNEDFSRPVSLFKRNRQLKKK